MLSTLLSLALLAGRPDVVLITIDTLRADHVGAYGSKRGATPTLDALALDGVVVEEAVVQVPMTRPSHTSLMTGLLPFQHGIRDNASAPLAASIPTLASTFQAAGYRTAAFIAAFPVSRASGLGRGFDVFDDPFIPDADRNERSAREVVDAALLWLAKPTAAPRFVWVHIFEPHYPYEPPAPFDVRFRASPYDGEVATADAELKRLLVASGVGASAIVVVTSDHGEGLGDHGEDEHHLFVYDSTLRVPLILSGPGLPTGRRVKGQFRSIDLMPTLLELADITAIPRMTGVSRAQNLRTGAIIPDNESYAESLYGSIHFGYAPVRALRGEGFKYIDTPQAELYRVASDPAEAVNLLAQRQPLATAMQTRLRALHGEDARKQVAAPPLDAATQERLASLGYVASGASVPKASASSTLPDAKTRTASYQRYSRAVNAALLARRHDNPSGVVKALQPIVAEFPTHLTVNSYLGQALLEQRRFNEAIPYLEKARDASAGQGLSWNRLAEALSGAGRRPEALDATEKGLAVSPRSADLIRLRVALLGRLSRGAEATRFLEASSAANPEDGVLLAEVSSLKRNTGDLRAADALSARAVILAPQKADVWLARGLTLGALERVPEAAEAFDRATQLDPSGADAWFYGATIAIQTGDRDRAAKMIARVQALDPQRSGLREVTAAIKALPPNNAANSAPKNGPSPAGAIRLSLIKLRTREGAAEVIRRIAAGEDFSALAHALSIDPSATRGGDLGAVRPSDLLPSLAAAATKLAPGGVSAIVEVKDGFVLLRRNP